jgi:hypothetical protein
MRRQLQNKHLSFLLLTKGYGIVIENDLEYGFDGGPAGVASHVDDDGESHLSHLVAETKNTTF